MRRRDIRKKQPTAWPWVAGLVVLAFLVWGVSVLLAPAPPEVQPEPDTPVEVRPPAAIPNAHRQPFVPGPGLADLAPLDEDDAGARVRVEGEVLAVEDEAFWIREDRWVLRVEAPVDLRPGARVGTDGVLRATNAETEVPRRVRRRVEREHWTLVRTLRLVPAPAGGDGGSDG